MKDPLERTKVVLRHLPPSLTEPILKEQIEDRFSGRYKWFFFRPGKNSQKNGIYARAYIDFKNPADVFEFAGHFDGHVFVNEKGTQFKVLVEYAPSQSIPRTWAKKDGREGSIFNDPDYLDFLELLAKPTENLPSAEIQLERREADRAGAKEAPIVTPLMDFVRRKRAAKSGSQRTSGNGKTSRRALVGGNSSSPCSKRGSEKRRGPSKVRYISKDGTKNDSGKEKPTYILVTRKDDQIAEKPPKFPFLSMEDDIQDGTGTGTNGIVSGVTVAVETGKRALLLLKGKDREGSHVQRLEVPQRTIKSILSKEGHQVSTSQPDHQLITGNKNDNRPPRLCVLHPNSKEHSSGSLYTSTSDADGKSHKVDKAASSELHTSVSTSDNKIEKRMRNKDRPDRGVWAPLRRSVVFHGHDTNLLPYDEIRTGHNKFDTSSGNRSSEFKSLGGGRGHHTSLDNGANRHAGHRGLAHVSKDLDVSASTTEAKPSKRGPNPYEKQIWVQKSGSAS